MEITLDSNEFSAPKLSRKIEPFLEMRIETPRYLLKSIDSVSELQEVLKLRAEIFFADFGVSAAEKALDVDTYDFHCDHLIILDRIENKLIGTYRLICSKFSDEFYTESEFDLKDFLDSPGIKLELGRACIHPDHRRGAVLNLLWRGVMHYARKTSAKYLFGCSSVKTENFSQAKSLMLHFELAAQVSTLWAVGPRSDYRIPHFPVVPPSEKMADIPGLLQSYLKAGAKIAAVPAYDAAFHCIDFLTVLNLEDLSPLFEKRYQVEPTI